MPLNHRALAELGARAEVSRLTTELHAILSEFPALAKPTAVELSVILNGRARKTDAPLQPITNGAAPRKRPSMSAAARKRMSQQMQKRWRAAKKSGANKLQAAAE